MATNHPHKAATLIGAGVGLAVFLGVALLPALVYGGYAGVMLAAAITGAPVHPTALVRVLIVAGMVLGVTLVAALFTIAGAAAGAAVSVLVSRDSEPVRDPRTHQP